MKKTWIPMLVLAAGLIAAGARAQDDDAPAPKDNRPCLADFKSLCKGSKRGQRWTCLMQNVDKIQNAACKARVEKFKAKDDAIKQACSAEISANCQGKDIGAGLLICLHKNAKSLSDGCKAALPKRKGRRGGKGQGGAQGGGQAPAAPAGNPGNPSSGGSGDQQ